MTSMNSSTLSGSKACVVSSKPWFLTDAVTDSGEHIVFVWKDGVRLKRRNGESAGEVKSVSVIDEGTQLLQVDLYS